MSILRARFLERAIYGMYLEVLNSYEQVLPAIH